jgi:hypothetical protein
MGEQNQPAPIRKFKEKNKDCLLNGHT